MSNIVAVIISDVHFNVQNLTLATKSLDRALEKAETLGVPLIIAGDLNDTKAIIRAEVANVLCETFKYSVTPTYIMVGNHDLCNEKGTENSLNFLSPYVNLVDKIQQFSSNIYMIPYYSDNTKLLEDIKSIPKGSILIMHQGFMGASMGDYVIDKSSISPDSVKDYTVISGHYHKHQTIGTITYVGSPYTMSFGEANDGDKGILLLKSDGTFERDVFNFRRHCKLTVDIYELNYYNFDNINQDDLLWLTVRGPSLELGKINKNKLLSGRNFKLELLPNDSKDLPDTISKQVTNEELFDNLIDATGETQQTKDRLKKAWRMLL